MPRPGKRELYEPYACWTVCADTSGRTRDLERASRGCRRADLPPVQPRVEPVRLALYLGRDADPQLAGSRLGGRPIDWRHPPEGAGEGIAEGCPGSWYRCGFIDSLLPYLRNRTQSGGRVSNRFYDRCDDDLIIEAVHYFELQEDRAAAAIDRELAERSK